MEELRKKIGKEGRAETQKKGKKNINYRFNFRFIVGQVQLFKRLLNMCYIRTVSRIVFTEIKETIKKKKPK